MGDSIVRRLDGYISKALAARGVRDTHVTNGGIGGDNSLNVLHRTAEMRLSESFKVGVVHVGINDIRRTQPSAASNDAPTIANNIMRCGEQLRSLNPMMDVIIPSVLNTKKEEGANQTVCEVNLALKAACTQDPRIHFIDVGRIQKNMFKDDVHLNKYGNQLFQYQYQYRLIKNSYPPTGPR